MENERSECVGVPLLLRNDDSRYKCYDVLGADTTLCWSCIAFAERADIIGRQKINT